MSRRKGELTASQIDRDWPFQVALTADKVLGHNHTIIERFCRDLALCPRTHRLRRGDQEFVVFAFSAIDDARIFNTCFEGERISPKGRELWR